MEAAANKCYLSLLYYANRSSRNICKGDVNKHLVNKICSSLVGNTWYMHLAPVQTFFLSLSLLARVICAMIAAILLQCLQSCICVLLAYMICAITAAILIQRSNDILLFSVLAFASWHALSDTPSPTLISRPLLSMYEVVYEIFSTYFEHKTLPLSYKDPSSLGAKACLAV